MLSDEEKKAIDYFRNKIGDFELFYGKKITTQENEYLKIFLNLIEKQSKEIEELKENYNTKLLSNAGIYQLGFNDGKKSVEDKIKAKIEEAKKNYNDLHTKHLRDCGIAEQRELAKIEFGQSLLEKE